jgi:hypothetical protein
MQRHVFDALGLAHTTADQNRLLITERSRFYSRQKDGSLENAPHVDNSYKWAGGGFLSTPRRPGDSAPNQLIRTKAGAPAETEV